MPILIQLLLLSMLAMMPPQGPIGDSRGIGELASQVQFRNVWIQDLSYGNQASDQEKGANALPKITASQKSLPLPGESFKLNGDDAFVILPKGSRKAEDLPWVWYAPTLNGLPAAAEKWMFERFLAAGVAIAGIDVGESYGSPVGRGKYDDFYRYLTESRKFNVKPCLLARSRGGLMLYSWAAENPQSVSGIAGIYPVCNLSSYPGIERACGAYELTAEQLTAQLANHNPVDRLSKLVEARVPIFHLHGDSDKVVPLDQNSAILAERYRALGGEMTLEIVEGQGHNMWSGWFQSDDLVKFVLTCLNRPLSEHPAPETGNDSETGTSGVDWWVTLDDPETGTATTWRDGFASTWTYLTADSRIQRFHNVFDFDRRFESDHRRGLVCCCR